MDDIGQPEGAIDEGGPTPHFLSCQVFECLIKIQINKKELLKYI